MAAFNLTLKAGGSPPMASVGREIEHNTNKNDKKTIQDDIPCGTYLTRLSFIRRTVQEDQARWTSQTVDQN
jgi:hypothetical protein